MATLETTERVNTVIIGGGQAGLSTGYHLVKRGISFVIVDDHARVGDVWRQRWDSLRLFTPARHAGLDGMPFPAPAFSFPTKDEMANYLEAYARTFHLPMRLGLRVNRVSRLGRHFLVVAGDRRFEAENVVIAMAHYQRARVPAFAEQLRSQIVQLHSIDYRNPAALAAGDVLIAGAGNSGADIAMELALRHRIYLAGPDTGHVPFKVDGLAARLALSRLVLRVVFHRILSVANPIGRMVRPRVLRAAAPLIRVKPKDLIAAGVVRVPRVVGAKGGLPLLEDGRVLDVANIIWCTGFDAAFSWIDLPVFNGNSEPRHEAGVVIGEPGLFFVGLHFLYAFSSDMIHGVGRDAARIADAIAARQPVRSNATRAVTGAHVAEVRESDVA
jgi:putative flavoprotein involved in K+ transport